MIPGTEMHFLWCAANGTPLMRGRGSTSPLLYATRPLLVVSGRGFLAWSPWNWRVNLGLLCSTSYRRIGEDMWRLGLMRSQRLLIAWRHSISAGWSLGTRIWRFLSELAVICCSHLSWINVLGFLQMAFYMSPDHAGIVVLKCNKILIGIFILSCSLTNCM